MNEDQALVVRLAALRQYAAVELREACVTDSQERAEEARAALASLAQLEREAA